MEIKILKRSLHLPLNGLNVSRRMEFSLLSKYLALQGEELLLDVACGDGYWTKRLARKAGAVIGFDFNRQRLRQAQKLSGGRIRGLIGSDAHFLPFKSGAFDAAVGICVLEHFDNDLQALSELRRVLKTGGKLALTVDSFSFPGITPEEKEFHAQKYHVVHWYRTENLQAVLQQAGLKLVESTYLLKTDTSAALYRQAKRSPKLAYALFPLAYPISLWSERISSNGAYGYKLAISAVAV